MWEFENNCVRVLHLVHADEDSFAFLCFLYNFLCFVLFYSLGFSFTWRIYR